jgi:hypothetical protein
MLEAVFLCVHAEKSCAHFRDKFYILWFWLYVGYDLLLDMRNDAGVLPKSNISMGKPELKGSLTV